VAPKGFTYILEGDGASYYDKVVIFKGTVSHDFLLQIFNKSSSYRPPIIPLAPFQIFSVNHEDILSSRFTTGIKDKW
jgi:hypothetical protein